MTRLISKDVPALGPAKRDPAADARTALPPDAAGRGAIATTFVSTARRFIRYGVACLLFLARSLQTENLIRTGEHRAEPTVMEGLGRREAPELPSESFPGSIDEILTLAGKPSEYTGRLFSGYLPLNNGGHAFYFLAESQSSTAQTDPVLLWLNGGPGSSSLMGCFSENGPLLVNEDGKTLRVNKFAWNQKANLLCIESPVGVGFSYNSSGVYEADDLSQAQDLSSSGNSLGSGKTTLSSLGELWRNLCADHGARHSERQRGHIGSVATINLKKFVVGNGVNEYMGLSTVMFAYYHGLLSTEIYQKFRASCPDLHEFEKGPVLAPGITTLTQNALPPPWTSTHFDIQRLVKELLTPSTPGKLPHPIGNTMDLCLDNKRLDSYFNLAEHPQMLKYTPSLHGEVTPLWLQLLERGVNGVIYHGDSDLVCNALGGLWAVESLGLPRLAPRSAWTYTQGNSKQTGGFVEAFKGISYVTVKGAGHLVPMCEPEEAKQMLDLFVLNDLK
ncbi:Serine carboxypeptidase [Phytophthora cactorum]|nr:Serine carboxypeptidase [Phytophthora cactorum]